MIFLRYFFYVVAGALASSLIGGAFACLVALVSPEFVKSLSRPRTVQTWFATPQPLE